MQISWTLNVVFLETDLTMNERAWYIRAAEQDGWSKIELRKQIASSAHLEVPLDGKAPVCYTEQEETVQEYENSDDKDTLLRGFLPIHYMRIDGYTSEKRE